MRPRIDEELLHLIAQPDQSCEYLRKYVLFLSFLRRFCHGMDILQEKVSRDIEVDEGND